jgi:hypothetical protein
MKTVYVKVPVEISIKGYEVQTKDIENILKKINQNFKIDEKFEIELKIIDSDKWEYSSRLII